MLNGALPPFDPEGGGALICARVMADAAMIQLFGAGLSRLAYAGPALPPLLERRLAWLARGAAVLAAASLLVWLWFQTASFEDAVPDGDSLSTVTFGTWFGEVLAAQFGLVVLAVVALGRGLRVSRWGLSAGLAALALGAEALHGHAWAMRATTGSDWLVASVVVHLLAAGAWLGGLLPLLILLADRARWRPVLIPFSKLGYACVAAIALTAATQAWVLVGGLPGLFGTAYGLVAMLKLSGFGVLVGIACLNRWRLGPRGSASLRWVIGIEAAVGLAVIGAAGLLSALPPSMHTQPVWPFDWQPTLATIREAPEFRTEILAAAGALIFASILLVAAILIRRWRWLLLVAGCLVAVIAGPHLTLLFAEATPATFATSPTGFSAASIALGAATYPDRCAACHGATGAGDGPAAASLSVPPANLLADHLWGHSDGELFWWISHGIADPADPSGTHTVMPPAGVDDDTVWALIDFLRARNAGRAAAWPAPIAAPAFACPPVRDGRVRLNAGSVAVVGGCTAADPESLLAWRLLLGAAPAEVLVDRAGWLRDVRRPGWPDDASAATALAAADAHPLAAANPAAHHHSG